LEKPTNSRFYNVATAASITGFQRAQLIRQIARSTGLIYCDTDCVAARDLGDLDMGNELGQWTLEADEDAGNDPLHTWRAIAGRKLYAWGNDRGMVKCASKGAKLYPQEIIEIAKGVVIEYKPQVPTFSVLAPPKFVEREIRLTR
jgi:DNA polymerase elongation subunit (family B)